MPHHEDIHPAEHCARRQIGGMARRTPYEENFHKISANSAEIACQGREGKGGMRGWSSWEVYMESTTDGGGGDALEWRTYWVTGRAS